MKIEYHGINDLNENGTPYYRQWGHVVPCISANTKTQTKFIKLDMKQAWELHLVKEGLVRDECEFIDFSITVTKLAERKRRRKVRSKW